MDPTPAAEHTFGGWLRQRRQELDLTRDELARQVGCSVVTLRKLEAEERRPSKPMAERLAEVLHIAPGDRPDFLRFARGDPFAGGSSFAAPPADTSEPPPAPRHNLPLQLTSFIGREREIEEIRADLTPPAPLPVAGRGEQTVTRANVRLLTLTGVGGAGKTRLALEVASGLAAASAFADGVWLVELAPLADPALVPQAAASALGLRETAEQPILAVLLNHLRPKRLLLVLDNCEHLVHACAELAESLLRACPQLSILATSRESLGVGGETVYPVPALTLPAANHPSPAPDMAQSEAVRLFAERARTVLPDFSVTGDNAAAVAQVCRQLDGIPLAIELAAARVKVMQVDEIGARLKDRFRLLTGGSRTALPRHQTLQALIDWSYDLLPAPERRLLGRLAVFVAGWTLEAAEAVCKDEGGRMKDESNHPSAFILHPLAVLDGLTSLANKSLVVVERQPGQAVRYRMLETIREYALAKLAVSGETDAVWRRLAEYFVEQVKTFELSNHLGGVMAYDRRLGPEFDNLRAVLAWSQSAAGSEALGLRLAGAVLGLWRVRGYWNEARGILEAALRRAQPAADPGARARALLGLGTLAYFQGEYAVAAAYLLDSLSLSRALNDRLASGVTLTYLGDIALEQGDGASALERTQEALALFRESGNAAGITWALSQMGALAVMQEDAPRAKAWLEEALALGREHAESVNIFWPLNGLGCTAQLEGDYARAWQLHSESLAQHQMYGEPNQFAPWAFQSLGQTALAQGDTALAMPHFLKALRVFRDEGDRGAISFCLAGLAGVAAVAGKPKRAAQLYGAAETLRQAIGARRAPATRATRERLMAEAREQLGEEAFAAAWTEGQRLSMEEAIRLALGEAG